MHSRVSQRSFPSFPCSYLYPGNPLTGISICHSAGRLKRVVERPSVETRNGGDGLIGRRGTARIPPMQIVLSGCKPAVTRHVFCIRCDLRVRTGRMGRSGRIGTGPREKYSLSERGPCSPVNRATRSSDNGPCAAPAPGGIHRGAVKLPLNTVIRPENYTNQVVKTI
jgi:hypothetical protein